MPTKLRRKVKAASVLAGKSLTQVAAEIGITVTHLHYMLGGKRNLSAMRLEQLATALGVSPGWLLGDDDGGSDD